MAFQKKTWKSRKTEYPNRRMLTKEDGSAELVTVSREEGNISEEGDAFSPANMNGLEDRIEAGFAEQTEKIVKIDELEREMGSLKKSVGDGKSTVANAITAQGVSTATDASFQAMAANVTAAGNARYNAGVAATKVGTAVAANVLAGKTFTNASSVGGTGTMKDFTNSPATITLEPVITKSDLVNGLAPVRKIPDTVTYDITPGYYTEITIDRTKVLLVDANS